jgi:hypothetical protein
MPCEYSRSGITFHAKLSVGYLNTVKDLKDAYGYFSKKRLQITDHIDKERRLYLTRNMYLYFARPIHPTEQERDDGGLQFLRANAGKLSRQAYDHFCQNHFQFTTHLSSYQYTLYILILRAS